ncbi:hypothetical protein NQ317_005657 [Molorchus minor]|uniref:Uncharacterized protein n=1 Tax=Molorchus minor TaxID=1323400 RepID=A0ABQ9K978_9CUCU|nr:hypothetical protein NQ317_005657 [Molorchus minor]
MIKIEDNHLQLGSTNKSTNTVRPLAAVTAVQIKHALLPKCISFKICIGILFNWCALKKMCSYWSAPLVEKESCIQ